MNDLPDYLFILMGFLTPFAITGLYRVFLFFAFENPSKSREHDNQIKLSKDLAKLITQSVVVRKVGTNTS